MKIVVIGGGAAGMSAASKAKRIDQSSDITVFEKTGYVSYAECGIPYYLSNYFDDYNKLLHYPLSEFTEKRKINIFLNANIEHINNDEKYVLYKDKKYYYDKLVLATGAKPKIPDNFANNVYTIRNIEDAINVNKNLKKSKDVTIIGAGVLGTELFSLLSKKYNVKLISKHERLLPHMDDDIGNVLNNLIKKYNNNIEYNSLPLNIDKNNDKYTVETTEGKHNADLVIFSAGISPENQMANALGIETKNNLIKVNDYMQTSIENIYAAGDNVTSRNIITNDYDYFPLAQIANKMGRTIGINLYGNTRKFPGSLGTTIINVFGYQVGYTGLNEKKAKELNYDYDTVFVKAKSKSNYLNGNDVYLKIIINKKNDNILGAQIIDQDNGAWRLNSIATAIKGKLSLYDLFYDDLGYEPEYGPVWDPIIIGASLGLDKSQSYI